jgi:hypothetical protein
MSAKNMAASKLITCCLLQVEGAERVGPNQLHPAISKHHQLRVSISSSTTPYGTATCSDTNCQTSRIIAWLPDVAHYDHEMLPATLTTLQTRRSLAARQRRCLGTETLWGRIPARTDTDTNTDKVTAQTDTNIHTHALAQTHIHKHTHSCARLESPGEDAVTCTAP